MKNILTLLLLISLNFGCTQKEQEQSEVSFEDQVADYIQKFPFQDSYDYMKRYTGGEAKKLNQWVLPIEPVLVKAGDDKVVRMNNDTYYNMSFMDLSKGPVMLSSSNPSDDRFYSFQLMDERNANFNNVINPDGDYYLYNGEAPTDLEGKLIESPTKIAVVIVRVEVKDMNDESDLESARIIFKGIDISGPTMDTFPTLDLLSGFDDKVTARATSILDSTFKAVPFRLTVAAPTEVGSEIALVNFAAGTKGGWGGPVTEHSSYETIFFDANGETLDGSKGDYTITTDEPPVDAFWSVTIYDTERGGFLHPNKENKYHINGATAVKNEDGTITFLFKKICEDGDQNCLEIPGGRFDYVTRYYLPSDQIRSGEWEMPKAGLTE